MNDLTRDLIDNDLADFWCDLFIDDEEHILANKVCQYQANKQGKTLWTPKYFFEVALQDKEELIYLVVDYIESMPIEARNQEFINNEFLIEDENTLDYSFTSPLHIGGI